MLARELEYHERLYSGFAQSHFARPAVRALRAHMVGHILRLTGLGPGARVLSLGCGIGDTELLLAPHVGELVGIDLSPTAIRQARADAERAWRMAAGERSIPVTSATWGASSSSVSPMPQPRLSTRVSGPAPVNARMRRTIWARRARTAGRAKWDCAKPE